MAGSIKKKLGLPELKIDFVKRPPYFDVSTTHRAKTWLLDPRAPKIEPPAAVRMLQEEGK